MCHCHGDGASGERRGSPAPTPAPIADRGLAARGAWRVASSVTRRPATITGAVPTRAGARRPDDRGATVGGQVVGERLGEGGEGGRATGPALTAHRAPGLARRGPGVRAKGPGVRAKGWGDRPRRRPMASIDGSRWDRRDGEGGDALRPRRERRRDPGVRLAGPAPPVAGGASGVAPPGESEGLSRWPVGGKARATGSSSPRGVDDELDQGRPGPAGVMRVGSELGRSRGDVRGEPAAPRREGEAAAGSIEGVDAGCRCGREEATHLRAGEGARRCVPVASGYRSGRCVWWKTTRLHKSGSVASGPDFNSFSPRPGAGDEGQRPKQAMTARETRGGHPGRGLVRGWRWGGDVTHGTRSHANIMTRPSSPSGGAARGRGRVGSGRAAPLRWPRRRSPRHARRSRPGARTC